MARIVGDGAGSNRAITIVRETQLKLLITKYRWALIVGAAALAVRLIYLFQIAQHPGFEFPMVDEKWHWEWAHSILDTSFWGEGAYFRAPLYPYFLALLAGVTGSSIFWSKLLQLLLTAGTAILIFRTAERLFGQRTAFVSGFMYAIYGTLLFYETMFLIPALFLMLTCWGMYRIIANRDEHRLRSWLITGLIFGLAAIARPNILLVMPFIALWLYYISSGKNIISRGRRPMVLLVGLVLAIAPVTARNVIMTGDFILISSQGGINLYLGNNAEADGLTMLMPEVDLDESVSWRQFGKVTRAAAQQEAGRELSDAQESSFWTGKAVSFISHNPGQFLSLIGRKTMYLVNGFENSDNGDIYYQRNRSSIFSLLVWKGWLLFPFGLLLPMAIAGVYLRRETWRAVLPVYVFILAYIPSIVLFLVTARHRLPLVPFLIILAAAGIVLTVERWRELGLRTKIIAALILVASLVVCNRDWFDEQAVSGTFQIHMTAGIQYEQMGDIKKAEAEYLAADAAYPYSAPLINNLAHTQYRLGKLAEARANHERCLAIDPEYSPAFNNLGLVMRDLGNSDSALALFRLALTKVDTSRSEPGEVGQIWLNIATAWDFARNLDSASAAYYQAIAAAPEWAKAYTQAGAFFGRHQGYRRADSLFLAASGMGTLTAPDYFNWGLCLIGGERYEHGIVAMRRALYMDPALYQAKYCIAEAYHRQGDQPDSVWFYLQQSLEAAPDYPPALEMKKMLEGN